jgi:hypothetical protein
MDLVIIGQPQISGLKLGKERACASPQKPDITTVFRLTQTEDAVVKNGLLVTLLHDTDDEGLYTERTIILDPIPTSEERRGRKRGWVKLRLRPLGTDVGSGLSGYLLFVSHSLDTFLY